MFSFAFRRVAIPRCVVQKIRNKYKDGVAIERPATLATPMIGRIKGSGVQVIIFSFFKLIQDIGKVVILEVVATTMGVRK